ncbi:Hypothetical protein I596_814 [Dokdonella koreensis DS-123]|uniref:Uncharacterized protein n=1 Tax=Dokdonella koreensis DS-123 TaxID=1300342 RepID=A0A160DSI4_9GAMM|nr:Hypothetical protein I596_814 [Dokdonella koreensis DS-123]
MDAPGRAYIAAATGGRRTCAWAAWCSVSALTKGASAPAAFIPGRRRCCGCSLLRRGSAGRT